MKPDTETDANEKYSKSEADKTRETIRTRMGKIQKSYYRIYRRIKEHAIGRGKPRSKMESISVRHNDVRNDEKPN